MHRVAYYPVQPCIITFFLEKRNLKVVPISVKYNLKFICTSETFFFQTEFGVVQEEDEDGEAVRPAPARTALSDIVAVPCASQLLPSTFGALLRSSRSGLWSCLFDCWMG